MGKYYSAVKDCHRYKRIHPFYRLIRAIIRRFFPENQILWKTEQPPADQPVFYVCNHTKLYAPVSFLLEKKTVRTWSNYYFLFYKTCWKHLRDRVLPGRPKILKPLAFLLTPFVVLLFRATEPIPVYHHTKDVMTTFQKSIETMEEGLSQVIFPERTENQVNKYVFEFNHGFPLVAQLYYEQTGKILQFYPVYCAEKLHTLVIGEPIAFDPTMPMKLQRKSICAYLENKIAELGDSLPVHEPVLYG